MEKKNKLIFQNVEAWFSEIENDVRTKNIKDRTLRRRCTKSVQPLAKLFYTLKASLELMHTRRGPLCSPRKSHQYEGPGTTEEDS